MVTYPNTGFPCGKQKRAFTWETFYNNFMKPTRSDLSYARCSHAYMCIVICQSNNHYVTPSRNCNYSPLILTPRIFSVNWNCRSRHAHLKMAVGDKVSGVLLVRNGAHFAGLCGDTAADVAKHAVDCEFCTPVHRSPRIICLLCIGATSGPSGVWMDG